jgi:hypothetical protein
MLSLDLSHNLINRVSKLHIIFTRARKPIVLIEKSSVKVSHDFDRSTKTIWGTKLIMGYQTKRLEKTNYFASHPRKTNFPIN